ncbi:MAG: GAF domain-containing protein [Kiritimatiellales bacterium]|jgi:PAS domain S-box-containing protein
MNSETKDDPVSDPVKRPGILPSWFSPAILLGSFILVFVMFLWLIRENTFRVQRKELVSGTEAACAGIRQRLSGDRDYLIMIAKDRGDRLMDTKSFQERASRYVADHPEMINITWVDAEFIIRDVAPFSSNKQIIGLRLELPEPKRASRLAMETRRPVYTFPFESIQSSPAFELWVPVFHDGVFLGLFGGVYSCEKMLRSVISPRVIETSNISMVDTAGKVIAELPQTDTVNEKLVYRTPPVLPEGGFALRFSGYGPGPVEWGLLLLEFLCLALVLGMAYAMWGLKREIDVRRQAEEAIRKSGEYNRSLIETSLDPLVTIGPDGRITDVNAATEAVTGYSRGRLIGTDFSDYFTEPEKARTGYKRVFQDGLVRDYPLEIRRRDGRVTPVLYNAAVYRDETGQVLGVFAAARDVTDYKRAEAALQRLNRELRALSSCSQVLVKIRDEQILLNSICRIICDEAGYRMAWVGYVENDTAKTVRPAAWAGSEDGYLAQAGITWADTERGQGPAGKAVRNAETVYVQNIATDPDMAPWRAKALRRGYHSTIALPLKDENTNVFGVLLIYSAEIDAFTRDEIRLLEELAGDLAFGIAALRTRIQREQAAAALAASETRHRHLSQHLETVREEERKWLARELHDDIGQILTAIKIDTVLLADELSGTGRAKNKISDMQKLLSDGIRHIHSFCRRLRPGALDDLGLDEALAGLVDDWKQRNEAECRLGVDVDDNALSDDIRTAVFRAVQEALTNISRHARASKVEINLVSDEHTVNFSVADNGCGIESGADKKQASFGLLGMHERIEALGGELRVESAPGKGTLIEGTIPLRRIESA